MLFNTKNHYQGFDKMKFPIANGKKLDLRESMQEVQLGLIPLGAGPRQDFLLKR